MAVKIFMSKTIKTTWVLKTYVSLVNKNFYKLEEFCVPSYSFDALDKHYKNVSP